MSRLAWVVLTILVAFAVAALAVRTALPPMPRGQWARRERAAARAGLRALQKVALAWLAIALLMAVPYAVALLAWGPERVDGNAAIRMPFLALFGAGLVAYGAVLLGMRLRIRWGRMVLDARDEAILARSPRAQVGALLVGIAAWTIGLAQAFHAAGQVPVAYMFAMFWSLMLLALAALPAGILAGYWGD